jgi:hypothetical protein
MALITRIGVVAVMVLFDMVMRELFFVATGSSHPPHTVTNRGSKASPKTAPAFART